MMYSVYYFFYREEKVYMGCLRDTSNVWNDRIVMLLLIQREKGTWGRRGEHYGQNSEVCPYS